MNLLIMGAPGAGKGTCSEAIINNYKIVHVSTGDMLRAAIKNETPVGLKASEYMKKGELVPDSIIHDIIVERLSMDDVNTGFLFDGYPRTLNQAVDLTSILEKLNKKIDCVINLEIEDETLIKRITGRRLCPMCGEIYNIYYKAPKKENTCDKCQSELTTRNDDNADSLKVRLSEYHKNAQDILEYYGKMNVVKNVNADQSSEQVFADIANILEGLK